jgi:hypothetical protein
MVLTFTVTKYLRGPRTRRFITAFTTVRHRSLSWASWIHSTPLTNLRKVHSDPTAPSTPRSSEWPLSFGLFNQNLAHCSLTFRPCHMPRPLHSLWFDLPTDIWGWVQIMKLHTVQLPPISRYFIPLRSKYSPQYPVLKHSQSMLFPQCETPRFTPIQKKTGRIMVLYILTFTFLDIRGEDKRLHRMVTSVSWIQSALNLFVHAILTC